MRISKFWNKKKCKNCPYTNNGYWMATKYEDLDDNAKKQIAKMLMMKSRRYCRDCIHYRYIKTDVSWHLKCNKHEKLCNHLWADECKDYELRVVTRKNK